jgi:hypothetical protein
MACEDSNCSCGNSIKMDGSGGVGDLAKLTINRTDDIQGEVEEIFVMPYNLINFGILQMYATLKQITAYTVRRLPKQTEEGR